jgi:hypothetical protein
VKRKPEGWSALLKTPEERRRFDRLCRKRKRSRAVYQPTNLNLAMQAMNRTYEPATYFAVPIGRVRCV